MSFLAKFFNQYKILWISLGALIYKLSSILFISDSETWDGSGHKVLLKIFIELSSQFLAEGYVDAWFGGFPAFRFYPSFFAFLGSLPFYLGLDIDTSFRISVWITVLFLISGYYYLVRSLLKPVFAVASLFLYLSFQGTPTLGISFSGIWGGNFPSLLGTGLSFYVLGILFRYNPKKLIQNKTALLFLLCTLCLLGFTHYLNFIFTYFIIFLMILFYLSEIIRIKDRNSKYIRNFLIIGLALTLPFIISIPSFYGAIFQSSESSGETLLVIYPFLENILGLNQSLEPFDDLIVNPVKLIPLLFSMGVFFYKVQNEKHRFLLIIYVSLFLMSQDLTVPKLLLNSGIHFYRAWDIFLGIHFLISLKGWSNLNKKLHIKIMVYSLALISLLILGYNYDKNPLDNQIYDDWQSELSKFTFDPKEFIFIEETSSYPWNTSPHKILAWLQKENYNTINGLMVESSWTSYLNRMYLPFKNKNSFLWGHQDPYITYNLVPVSSDSSLNYLHQRNITKVLSKTQDFRTSIQELLAKKTQKKPSNPEGRNNESIIQIHPLSFQSSDSISNKPEVIGLIKNETLLNLKSKSSPRDFFIKSFYLQNSNQSTTYIELDPAWKQKNVDALLIPLDRVIIYSDKDFQSIEEMSANTWKRLIDQKIDANFFSSAKTQINTTSCEFHKVNQSYFPDLYLETKSSQKENFYYFRTHFNQTLVCGQFSSADKKSITKLQFPIYLGRIKFLLMIFIFLSWILSSLLLLMKTKA